MNRIILLGRLTRDPEVKLTPSEKTVCTFTLAVDRQFTAKDGQKEADFINIVVWGKAAELCGNYVSKGQRLLVEGRLQIRSYEAKDGSGRRYVTEVVADRVEFVERKPSSENNASGGGETSCMEKAFGDPNSPNSKGYDEEIPF